MNDNRHKETFSTTLILQELPINWKWMLFLGGCLIVLGTFGLAVSGFVTLTSILIFGGFIFAGGILQIIHAVQTKERDWAGKLQHMLIACLYVVAGLIIFWDPLGTSIILTVLIAALFVVIGIAKVWYASYCKKQDWKWLLPAFSGALNLVLAAIIIASLPDSAIWLIGMLIAIEMLFNGWFILLLGLRVRKSDNNKLR